MIKKIITTIILMFIVLTWIFHTSVNSYYEMVYQKPSPLVSLNNNKAWKFGDQIKNFITSHINNFNQRITYASNVVNEITNEYVLNKQVVITNDTGIDNENGNAEKNGFISDTDPLSTLINKIENENKIEQPKELINPAIIDKIAGPLDYRNYNASDFPDIAHHDIVYLKPNNRVLFIGDSLQQGVALIAKSQLTKKLHIHSVDLSAISTGLVYPDFFNWNKTLADTLNNDKSIGVVVVLIGANDQQNMINKLDDKGQGFRFGSKRWKEAYLQRSMSLIYNSYIHNIPVIWLTLPNMRKHSYNERIKVIKEVQQQATSQYGTIVISTNKILGIDNEDEYKSSLLINGKNYKIRTADGIHFDVAASRLITAQLLNHIKVINSEENNNTTNEIAPLHTTEQPNK